MLILPVTVCIKTGISSVRRAQCETGLKTLVAHNGALWRTFPLYSESSAKTRNIALIVNRLIVPPYVVRGK